MLDELFKYINNWFVVKDGVHAGTYTISSNTIELDFLQENQYFRIVGSVFNDGVYKYPACSLVNEEFDGEIWALAVPRAVLSLAEEIEKWVETYGDKVDSPYSSESFGGYSYTKASGISYGDNTNASPINWQSVFRSKLNMWRKI